MIQVDDDERASAMEGTAVSFECEAVLSDMDGVLIDSSDSVAKVWREWAETHGLNPDAVLKRLV